MRNEDFEIGKKYVLPACNVYYTCVGRSLDGRSIMENGHGRVWKVEADNFYEPYKEPAKGSFWVNVYKDGMIGSDQRNREDADKISERVGTRIACIKVDWVEGQGLDKGADQ